MRDVLTLSAGDWLEQCIAEPCGFLLALAGRHCLAAWRLHTEQDIISRYQKVVPQMLHQHVVGESEWT
jgi:hypothetical protein